MLYLLIVIFLKGIILYHWNNFVLLAQEKAKGIESIFRRDLRRDEESPEENEYEK